MTDLTFTEEQTDALQEVVNIAMGQAGDSLARILDSLVRLSVPRLQVVEVAYLSEVVRHMTAGSGDITAVRQSFFNKLNGESIVILSEPGCSELAELMGYESRLDAQSEQELLLDVANVLIGACLNGIAEQLETELSFSAPSVMGQNTSPERLLSPHVLPWHYALLVEINFSLENRRFKSHLLILTAEDAITALGQSLDELIDSL